jgi:Mor family transcriptional regulator
MSGLIKQMRTVVTSVTNDEKQASEIVHALIKNFGGERLYIPCNDHERRNLEMRSLHRAGATATQLAKRYRLRTETVYRIIQ